jgi:hypothetical protein
VAAGCLDVVHWVKDRKAESPQGSYTKTLFSSVSFPANKPLPSQLHQVLAAATVILMNEGRIIMRKHNYLLTYYVKTKD